MHAKLSRHPHTHGYKEQFHERGQVKYRSVVLCDDKLSALMMSGHNANRGSLIFPSNSKLTHSRMS